MPRVRHRPEPPRKPRNPARRRSGSWAEAARGLGPILVVGPLAVFTAVFVAGGPPAGEAAPSTLLDRADREAASFARCGPGPRDNCVIDGDTFWYRGEKIRISDINTPETGKPGCVYEAQLGARATGRLVDLLNAGPFTLEAGERDRDTYGRQLRTVMRNGASVGAVLVDEGLAEPWRGTRSSWC
jgi:endonuclease YncB( thermonuclease family)